MKVINRVVTKSTGINGEQAKQWFTLSQTDKGVYFLTMDRLYIGNTRGAREDKFLRTWKGHPVFYASYSVKISSLQSALDHLFIFDKEEQK